MKGFNQIQALLGQELDPTDPDYQYEKYEWINNLNDKNDNNYSTGLVEIDTVGVSDGKWLDYHNAYLTVPISIYGETEMKTAAANATKVAVKNSVTQFIYSIKLALGVDSFVVQNSDNINLYNHIRSMVNDDVNYAETNGAFFHQSKDTSMTNEAYEYKSPIVLANGLEYTDTFNKGFRDRIRFMDQYYERLSSTESYYKLLHISLSN